MDEDATTDELIATDELVGTTTTVEEACEVVVVEVLVFVVE